MKTSYATEGLANNDQTTKYGKKCCLTNPMHSFDARHDCRISHSNQAVGNDVVVVLEA